MLRKYDVAYFAASCDVPKTNREFAHSLQLDYPILSDPTKKTARAYGVVTPLRPLPHRWTFFISREGKILAIDKHVQPASHGRDVATRLKELHIPLRANPTR